MWSTTSWDSASVLLAGTPDWVSQLAHALETETGATVRRAATTAEAVAVYDDGPVDCLVTAYALEDGTGLQLLRRIREKTETLPVILCTATGSETVASDAIAAGVTEYIPLEEPVEDVPADVLNRTAQHAATDRRTGRRRDRARQFDTIFRDTRTATWVLDPDGALARANQTARDMVEPAVDDLLGESFWTLPWWSRTGEGRADVRRIIETAQGGTYGSAVVARERSGEPPQRLDLSARPVEDDAGDLVSIVVDAVDVTERVSLERELRRSEELHRVTLNNMTDTVLITDDDGEYTYVCPNVHFIFGYTADEIREMGTIDALLGPDLFDRDALAEDGVLKNIECTATDKAGREHTLLVNVREVSIRDGTLLYSCRDITKRKQREEALATLQETARDFLYAETHQEIAQHVVDDTPGVLDLDASAVYLFDADENELRPAARSAEMDALNGPLPSVRADGAALPSYSFVEDERLFFDDVHDAERLSNQATGLRSAAYIPLGDHGVFVAGAPDVGEFDDVTRELADLLAATAEAALDRVDREARLREQDRELQHRNDRLTRLDRINETIREIGQALVRAETRDEICHTVCERLTDDDRFAFAWIGDVDGAAETVEPQAWAGAEQGYLDSLTVSVSADGAEPAGRTAATGDVAMVANVAERLRDEGWRKNAIARDYLSVLSIPLAYTDITYGVLTVYAETRDAFDDTSRAVMAELGETIAAAISAIERKNALLTTSMTRVEFSIDDPTFVLSRLARDADCTLTYQGGVQLTADGSYVFVSVEDAPVDAVEEVASELVAIDDVQRIGTDGSGGVLRLGLRQPFLALELADHGAVFHSASADPTATTLRIDVPDSVDVRHVTQLVRGTFSDVELRSKRSVDQAAEYDLASTVFDQVTDRQLEVLQTAYYSGFFESPRESTGEEIADTLGISPAAFYQHARTVERKVFSTMFEDVGLPATTARVPDGVEY